MSSQKLRTRHYKWLSKFVLSHCGLALRFSGHQEELISVLDMAGKEPVGLGNISRLGVNELVYRYAAVSCANSFAL